MNKKVYARPDFIYYNEYESDIMLASGWKDTLIDDQDVWDKDVWDLGGTVS